MEAGFRDLLDLELEIKNGVRAPLLLLGIGTPLTMASILPVMDWVWLCMSISGMGCLGIVRDLSDFF